VIRWRIGTGELAPGDALPPIRSAARAWGVNLHTVRRAYRVLVDDGMLTSRPGVGTTVQDGRRHVPSSGGSEAVGEWLDELVALAAHRFALTPAQLGRHFARRYPGRDLVGPLLVECNEHQCRDLADQVARRWDTLVEPWSMERPGDPPPGLLIGTHFHSAEMKQRWPDRAAHMHFIGLRMDPAIDRELSRRLASLEPTRLILCERNMATGRQMAADIECRLALPPIEVTTASPDRAFEDLHADELLLVAPRCWGSMPHPARRDDRVMEVRHVIRTDDLEALGDIL
jgi:DNA-binding transcriptional regulator YhcF (GntR family)